MERKYESYRYAGSIFHVKGRRKEKVGGNETDELPIHFLLITFQTQFHDFFLCGGFK